MNTEIYLRRRNKIAITTIPGNEEISDAYLVTLQKNLECLGYTLSGEALKVIKQLDEAQIVSLYGELIEALKQLVGAHVQYKPMYPNFPSQVARADEVELYINAQLHYFGDWLGVRILPDYEKLPRDEFTDKVKLRTIGLGNTEDFNSIFTNITKSKTSMSDVDKQDIEWFVKNFGDSITAILPNEMPNKENVATVSS